MAREHSSWPGQSADMVTSVMAGMTTQPEKTPRKIVTKRCLRLANFSILLLLLLLFPFVSAELYKEVDIFF